MVGKTKLKAGCGLSLVFVAGFLCGAIALFVIIVKVVPLSEGWRDEESKEFVMKHLANQLDLTDQQVSEIEPIVNETLDRRYSHRKVYVLADIDLTREAKEKIEPLLDGKQKTKIEKMFANWEKGKKRFVMPDSSDTETEQAPDPAQSSAE